MAKGASLGLFALLGLGHAVDSMRFFSRQGRAFAPVDLPIKRVLIGSQRSWEQRMGGFVDMEVIQIEGLEKPLVIRDFYGSWALDFESASWLGGAPLAAYEDFADEAGVFLDVGANLGLHSIYIASRFPKSLVIAIEANPVLFRLLQWNLRVNNVTETVWPLNIALSQGGSGDCVDGQGVDCVTLKLQRNHRAAYITELSSCQMDPLAVCFQIPAWSLRKLLKRFELEKIHHLKLNCEGCEYHVLSDPEIRHMKDVGRIGRISGHLHPFQEVQISSHLVQSTLEVMCREEFVRTDSLCEKPQGGFSDFIFWGGELEHVLHVS